MTVSFPSVVNRNVEFPSRVKLTPTNGGYTEVEAAPGTVYQPGTPLNSTLFTRIKDYINFKDNETNMKLQNFENETSTTLSSVQTSISTLIDDVSGMDKIDVLWKDKGLYMQAGHVAKLSKPISKTTHGIVLHWQGYDTETKPYHHQYFFVPKFYPFGQGYSMFLIGGSGSSAAYKYLYIRDTEVEGNAANNAAPYTSPCGIKMTPKSYVLTEILGV